MNPPTPMRNPPTLEGSFSAVSTPPIARVGSFFSIFRDQQYLHTFAPLQIQQNFVESFAENFIKFCNFRSNSSFFTPLLIKNHRNFTRFLLNFCREHPKLLHFDELLTKFHEFSSEIVQFQKKSAPQFRQTLSIFKQEMRRNFKKIRQKLSIFKKGVRGAGRVRVRPDAPLFNNFRRKRRRMC